MVSPPRLHPLGSQGTCPGHGPASPHPPCPVTSVDSFPPAEALTARGPLSQVPRTPSAPSPRAPETDPSEPPAPALCCSKVLALGPGLGTGPLGLAEK